MARPTLHRNLKWTRLVRALGGDEIVARGALELMWDVAYENGDEYLGTSEDVELAARWRASPGSCPSLLNAGREGEAGFIEELPDLPGKYRVTTSGTTRRTTCIGACVARSQESRTARQFRRSGQRPDARADRRRLATV
jgi:hypothetical protein